MSSIQISASIDQLLNSCDHFIEIVLHSAIMNHKLYSRGLIGITELTKREYLLRQVYTWLVKLARPSNSVNKVACSRNFLLD